MILNKDIAIGWIMTTFPNATSRRGGDEITMPSPFPKIGSTDLPNQSKHQIWFNIEKDMWKCWASGKHGRFWQLVCEVERCDRSSALDRFYENRHVGALGGRDRRDQRPSDAVAMPRDSVRISESTSQASFAATEYLRRRGLRDEDIATVHVVPNKNESHYGYAIFPFFGDRGQLIYWQGRDYTGASREKYVAPPKNVASREHVIYARDWGFSEHPVFVVEGLFDVIGLEYLGLHGVAILGSELSEQQVRIIKAHGGTEVVVAVDLDAAGEAAACRMLDLLHASGCTVKRVQPPSGKDMWDYYYENRDNVDAARMRLVKAIGTMTPQSAMKERLVNALNGGPKPERQPRRDRFVEDDGSIMRKIQLM